MPFPNQVTSSYESSRNPREEGLSRRGSDNNIITITITITVTITITITSTILLLLLLSLLLLCDAPRDEGLSRRGQGGLSEQINIEISFW